MQTIQKHHPRKYKRLSLTEKLAIVSTIFTFLAMIAAYISLFK